jgi:hypothetical protein
MATRASRSVHQRAFLFVILSVLSCALLRAHAIERWLSSGDFQDSSLPNDVLVAGLDPLSYNLPEASLRQLQVGVCRFFAPPDSTIVGYFQIGNRRLGGPCEASLNGQPKEAYYFEFLAGNGMYWTHVDYKPGGVVAGTEHKGAQKNGICRQQLGSSGAYFVGKDYGGHCFFSKDNHENVSDGNDYDVLKH